MAEHPSGKEPENGIFIRGIGGAPSLSSPLREFLKISRHGDQFRALLRVKSISSNCPLATQASKCQHFVVVEFGGKVVSIAAMGKRGWMTSHRLG